MKKYLFLIPVYNDWQSLNLLLKNIDQELSRSSRLSHVLVINDGSNISIDLKIDNYKQISKLEILNLRENLGSQKSIAIGLKHLESSKEDYIITILDSDGEDDPQKINEMLDQAEKNEDFIITSNRTNRKENPLFKILYLLHKITTYLFTGYWISFGNFSSFHSKNLKKLLVNNNVWFAYSSAVAKNCKIKRLYAKRLERYYGKSKVNFLSLVVHSLRVISVLNLSVIAFSSFYCLILFVLYTLLSNFIFLIFIYLILFFNFLILIVKISNNEKSFINWRNFIQDKTSI